MATTQLRKQSRPIQHDAIEDDDTLYTTRLPSSARRYRTAPPPPAPSDTQHDLERDGVVIQRRRSRSMANPTQHTSGILSNAVTPKTEALPPLSALRPLHALNPRKFPVVYVLIGVVLSLVLFMAASALGSWWTTYQNDLHYGRPRTYQFDAVVGHNDSPDNPTHFILINLNSHIEVIEIPGGDVSHTRIYTGPTLYGPGQDLTPVTGSIRMINGKADLVLTIQNQHFLFINNGTTFQAP
jgi:hypothetical protein